MVTTRGLLDILSSESEEKLDKISLEDFEKAYEKMRKKNGREPL